MPTNIVTSDGAETSAQLRRVDEMLRSVPDKIARRILLASLRGGAMQLVHAARSNVPVRTGALIKSIRLSVSTKRRTVDVKAGGRGRWGDAYYAHFVEFGTERHVIKPKRRASLFFARIARETVDHPGSEERPFMRPAFDTKSDAAIAEVARVMRERLEKELKA